MSENCDGEHADQCTLGWMERPCSCGERGGLFTACMHACVLGLAESPYHCVEQTDSDLYCGLLLRLSCHHHHHHYHINKKYTKIKEKER